MTSFIFNRKFYFGFITLTSLLSDIGIDIDIIEAQLHIFGKVNYHLECLAIPTTR